MEIYGSARYLRFGGGLRVGVHSCQDFSPGAWTSLLGRTTDVTAHMHVPYLMLKFLCLGNVAFQSLVVAKLTRILGSLLCT